MTQQDRIVAVTGAASGIGLAVCRAVRDAGWTPFGIDRAPGEEVALQLDLTDAAAVERDAGAAFAERRGLLGGLVNAAGMGYPEPFEEADDDSWMRVFEINLMATVRLCRLAIPVLRSYDGDRSIVNFGSQAGKAGGIVIGAHYSAAKAAVMCLTKSLAGAYGPEGIRVNALAPGIVETAFLDQVPTMRDAAARIPLRRLGRPDEVAQAAIFLLGSGSSYITGEIMDVNGGLLMD